MDYWYFYLHYLNYNNNCFYALFIDHFPTREEIVNIIKTDGFGIITMQKLTEEQYNMLHC